MKIGIITDPATTFRFDTGKRSPIFDIFNIPDKHREEKYSFLDYFSGNFSEIKSLMNELSDLGQIEAIIFQNNQFIHQDESMKIMDLFNIRETNLNLNKWIDGCDVLIISIGKSNIRSFMNMVRIPEEKTIIVSSGLDDKKLFDRIDLHLVRKGVARFGRVNRERIRQYIKDINDTGV